MTSKERLEELLYYATLGDDGSKPLVKLYAEQIKKDLEVLDILKNLINHLEATFNTKYFSDSGIMGTIIKDYFINNDITGKIEEWLNNDN